MYLELLANLAGDAEINAPDDIFHLDEQPGAVKRKTSPRKGSYKVTTQEVFYLKNDIANAKMQVLNGNRFVVLEGSTIDPHYYSDEPSIKKLRQQYAAALSSDGSTIISDIEFGSPSAAANFVRGGASNGKMYWRTISDLPLNDFIEYDN